jgi:hypothetical protein
MNMGQDLVPPGSGCHSTRPGRLREAFSALGYKTPREARNEYLNEQLAA